MKKETVRSLGQIMNLMEQQNQFKRYMRVQEATRNYQLDRRILCRIAKECDALFKVNSTTLIEMDTFEVYPLYNHRKRSPDPCHERLCKVRTYHNLLCMDTYPL